MDMKKFLPRKNKVFLSWSVSYAVILIIPIFIGIFVYIQSVQSINAEVNKAHNLSLKQLKSVIDGKFEELIKLSGVISMNQNIQKLMYPGRDSLVNEIYTVIEAQKDIGNYKISNSSINNAFIYINRSNLLFSGTYKYDKDEVANVCKNEIGISPEVLVQLVHANQNKTCLITGVDSGQGVIKKKIVFIQSIYLSDYKIPTGAFIAVLDGEKLLQLLKNLEWTSQGKTILVNSKNEFIDTRDTGNAEETGDAGETAETGNAAGILPEFAGFDSLKNSSATFYERTKSGNIAVTHVKSGIISLEYVSLIPTKIFLQRVEYIKNMIIIYVVVCLIVGFITAYFLVKRNYSPVKNLTQMLVSRLGNTEGSEYNEFKYLESSLKNLFEQNSTIMTSLKQQNEALRNNLIAKLIKGRIRSLDYISDSLETYGIRFKSDKYLVMAFFFEKFGSQLFAENIEEDENSLNLLFFIIKNVVEELVNEKHIGYMAEIDGMMVCLVNLVPGDPEAASADQVKAEMLQIVHMATEFIENKFEVLLNAAVSDLHSGLSGMSDAYQETLEVFEYKALTEDPDRVMHYSSFRSTKGNAPESHNSLEKERLFINCIKAEDFKNAREILDDIITNDLGRNLQSLQLVKCRMFGLINSMLNAMGEIRPVLDISFFDALDPVNRLLKTKSVIELKKQADNIFDKITDYFEQRDKKELPVWLTDVEEYVKGHYCEADLSIAGISEQFNISVSYLSRAFKKHEGIGLLDYIHKMRLDKAKQLMNTNMSLRDIAEKAGYVESKALIRSFKRYEGITPGRFRDIEPDSDEGKG